MLAPGDSDRSSFITASSGFEEIEVDSTELLVSKDEEADEGRDTTMYFCIGREPVSPGPLPDSSLTKGCKVEVALGTVLVTGEADWEELRVITWREDKKTAVNSHSRILKKRISVKIPLNVRTSQVTN